MKLSPRDALALRLWLLLVGGVFLIVLIVSRI
jgi:hypothetical protein